MKIQKLILKTAYCLAGLLFIASIGVNISQYQQFKKLSNKPVPGETTKHEPTGQTMSAPVEMVQKSEIKSTTPASKEKNSNPGEINELEYQLDATEEELDMTNEQLDDELSKKAEYKKTRDQLAKNMSSLSNPVNKKMIIDSLTPIIGNDYDPLFKKLNISKEKFDEFKGMLVEQRLEEQNLGASMVGASSAEEEEKLSQQGMEIEEKFKNRISELLGEEKNELYKTYESRLQERRSLREFMETQSPDNRINEEQTEALIDSMYEARKAVYDEMGPGPKINSASDLTEETLSQVMEISARANEKYVEVSRGIMKPEQVKQYKAFLKQKQEMTESVLKMSLYLNDNK